MIRYIQRWRCLAPSDLKPPTGLHPLKVHSMCRVHHPGRIAHISPGTVPRQAFVEVSGTYEEGNVIGFQQGLLVLKQQANSFYLGQNLEEVKWTHME